MGNQYRSTVETIEMLLEMNADPNLRDGEGRPSHLILMDGSLNCESKLHILQHFMHYGVDFNLDDDLSDDKFNSDFSNFSGSRRFVRTALGRSIFYCQHPGRFEEELNQDITRIFLNLRDSNGKTQLWHAANEGRTEDVRLILNIQEADLDSELFLESPMGVANANGHFEIVRLIHSKNQDQ